MSKKKIAIYSGDIPSTTFIENLIKAVADQNNSILIFGIIKRPVKYNNKFIHVYSSPGNNLKVIPFAWWSKLKLIFKSRTDYNKLSSYINSRSLTTGQYYKAWAKYAPVVINLPDIFHIQWAKSLNEWMFLKTLFGVKIVLSLRGAHINYSPVADKTLAKSYRNNFPYVDSFHAVSENIATNSQIYGADATKITVIYSGINFNATQINSPKKNNKVLNIISAGRFHWKKGYQLAVEAMNELKMKQIPFHYTIISSGGDREEVQYRISELGLNNYITIMGGMSQKNVLKQIHEHDLLLLPSIEEGIANVVLEAMAVGTIVLSSNCGGMEEVIQHGSNGFIFQNREIRDMVQNIEQINYLSENEKISVLEKAKDYVKNNHSLDILKTKMSALYDKTSSTIK